MYNSKFSTVVAILVFVFSISLGAQVNKISLEQTPGEFTTQGLTITPGDYQFEISNNGVDHEVGFVLAPKGKTEPANHIKAAYVTAPVKTGASAMTSVVSLAAGEYVYFCPMNPTKEYPVSVVSAEKITLTQVPGEFVTKGLVLSAGNYEFEIQNKGVDHEVGFVLAPKGKTDAANHIKTAYVKAPAQTGTSSMTNIVTLAAGEYVYFCPLNPTAEYPITVK